MEVVKTHAWSDMMASLNNKENNDCFFCTEATSTTDSLNKIATTYNVRNISPREMVKMSFELFKDGVISLEEYALLSFQPEIHADFERFSGEPARPDEPRNYIGVWKSKVNEHLRFGSPDSIASTRNALSLLERIDMARMQQEAEPLSTEGP